MNRKNLPHSLSGDAIVVISIFVVFFIYSVIGLGSETR